MDQEDRRYPLCWPAGWKRTKSIKSSPFRVTEAKSRDDMCNELYKLGVSSIIISTNLELRLDGLPRANQGRLDDPGVAIYFKLDGNDMTMACDTYCNVGANFRAIGNTVAALRTIKQHGASYLLDRAFMGFKQIPHMTGTERTWQDILGVSPDERDIDRCRQAYRDKAMRHHPDQGGTHELMAEINTAWCDAREALT